MEAFKLLAVLFCVGVCDGAGPNIPCMLMNCFEQSKDCMEDQNCRTALFCITECGETNQTCMFGCLYSYEDKIFDDFMKCVSTEHDCIPLVPPNPPVVCRPPPTYVKDFTLDQLNGSWYIVRGKNPLYDCFDCQITSFHPMTSPSIYSMYRVNEKFDVHAIQGGIVHREVNETVEQTDPGKGGLLNYTSSQMGHKASSQWRILDYAGNYVLAYYCGRVTDNWFFEGSVVYSRTPTLSETDLQSLQTSATKLGIDLSTYCKPKTSDCAA